MKLSESLSQKGPFQTKQLLNKKVGHNQSFVWRSASLQTMKCNRQIHAPMYYRYSLLNFYVDLNQWQSSADGVFMYNIASPCGEEVQQKVTLLTRHAPLFPGYRRDLGLRWRQRQISVALTLRQIFPAHSLTLRHTEAPVQESVTQRNGRPNLVAVQVWFWLASTKCTYLLSAGK